MLSRLLLGLGLACLAAAQTTREQFAALAASHGGVIKLNTKTFDAITSPDRDWSVVVQMTALSGHSVKCEPCLQWAPNYDAVAKSWKKVPKEQRDYHFFATLEFKDGQDVFRRMGIQTAPFVHFYPAAKGPLVDSHPSTKMWVYDFNTFSFDPSTFAEQLSPHTPTKIPYSPPPNYGLIISALVTAAGLVAAYVFLGDIILAFLASRWIWGVFSLGFILYMLGGAMFVRIRQAPYAGAVRGRDGQPVLSYVAGGYQSQYGAETWMISGLYTLLAASQISLIALAPRLPSASRQRAAVIIWLAVSWMLFSVLLAIFRVKNSGYPFRLLL